MNIHIYRHNRLSRRRPLVYCCTYNVIRPVSLPSPVNKAQDHEQFITNNARNRRGSTSVLCMLDWTHLLPNSSKIIQYLWTDRSGSPLLCSVLRERCWSSNDGFMSGLFVFCCLRPTHRRTVVVSCIVCTFVTLVVIRTYFSPIYT